MSRKRSALKTVRRGIEKIEHPPPERLFLRALTEIEPGELGTEFGAIHGSSIDDLTGKSEEVSDFEAVYILCSKFAFAVCTR